MSFGIRIKLNNWYFPGPIMSHGMVQILKFLCRIKSKLVDRIRHFVLIDHLISHVVITLNFVKDRKSVCRKEAFIHKWHDQMSRAISKWNMKSTSNLNTNSLSYPMKNLKISIYFSRDLKEKIYEKIWYCRVVLRNQ